MIEDEKMNADDLKKVIDEGFENINEINVNTEGDIRIAVDNTLNLLDGVFAFILIDKKTRRPHGTFSLTNVFSDRPEIGKLLGTKEIRGKGIAYRSTKTLLDFAFRELNLKKVYSITRSDNIANNHLNQKLGFKVIGSEKINSKKFIIMSLKNNLV